MDKKWRGGKREGLGLPCVVPVRRAQTNGRFSGCCPWPVLDDECLFFDSDSEARKTSFRVVIKTMNYGTLPSAGMTFGQFHGVTVRETLGSILGDMFQTEYP